MSKAQVEIMLGVGSPEKSNLFFSSEKDGIRI